VLGCLTFLLNFQGVPHKQGIVPEVCKFTKSRAENLTPARVFCPYFSTIGESKNECGF
jgi:hypothetical protein